MLDIHELKTTSRVYKSNLIFVVLIPIYSDLFIDGGANTILSSSLYWSTHGKNAFPHPFIAGQTPSLNCTVRI
jgi:hypothetical protein